MLGSSASDRRVPPVLGLIARAIALDNLDDARIGADSSLDQLTTRKEVTNLLRHLKLRLDKCGRRATNRTEGSTRSISRSSRTTSSTRRQSHS
jgi:hypothetical protein